jgi:hypothetical protein
MLQKLLDWHGSAFTADFIRNSTGTQSMKKIAVVTGSSLWENCGATSIRATDDTSGLPIVRDAVAQQFHLYWKSPSALHFLAADTAQRSDALLRERARYMRSLAVSNVSAAKKH